MNREAGQDGKSERLGPGRDATSPWPAARKSAAPPGARWAFGLAASMPAVAVVAMAFLLIENRGNRASGADQGVGQGVLIDAIHANDFSTVGLKPGVYEYPKIIGHRIAMEYLRARGIRCDRATEGPLDANRLAACRMLFVPLVSAERPPWLVSEIAAVKSFVRSGGSLFVVTDHTNVYFHAHVLRPLFAELQMASFTDAACEDGPRKLGQGAGWISVVRFSPHPITSHLKCIALQTCGCVDPRFAVAWTSEHSWADAWRAGLFGEENAPGFCGNFVRDPGESAGPLGVVLAKTFGAGRIVVVGDQNMLGDAFINYADNYRLWLNAAAWLLGRDALGEPAPYENWQRPRILVYERYDRAAVGVSEPAGCYHVWALLCRHYWTFANDRVAEPADLIVFPYNDLALPPEHAAAVASHLRRGRNVLVLNAERATLTDEASVIGQLMAAVGDLEPKRRDCPGKTIFEFPGGGAIHVLGPDVVYDNGTVAEPTRAPTPPEQERNRIILQAVGEAVGSVGSPPASPAAPSTSPGRVGQVLPCEKPHSKPREG